MTNTIEKKYNFNASGLLTIDNGHIYISIEDGPQDVNIANLLCDFDGKYVKLSIDYSEKYAPINVDTNNKKIFG